MRHVTLSMMISIMCGALAQLAMKAGLIQLGPLDDFVMTPANWLSASSLVGLAFIGSGVLGYLVAVLLWISVLKVYPLSLAYPLLSLGYIVVYLGSVWWPLLSESFNLNKSAGVFLIIIGVIIVAQTYEENRDSE